MLMNKEPLTFTFIARTAPYGSNRGNLLLDIALTTSVFEHNTNYVFLGDGVFQLLKDQDADQIKSKTLGKALQALNLYGINNIFIQEGALSDRAIAPDDLILEAKTLNQNELSTLIKDSDNIISL